MVNAARRSPTKVRRRLRPRCSSKSIGKTVGSKGRRSFPILPCSRSSGIRACVRAGATFARLPASRWRGSLRADFTTTWAAGFFATPWMPSGRSRISKKCFTTMPCWYRSIPNFIAGKPAHSTAISCGARSNGCSARCASAIPPLLPPLRRKARGARAPIICSILPRWRQSWAMRHTNFERNTWVPARRAAKFSTDLAKHRGERNQASFLAHCDRLLAARRRRPRPERDEKIVADWKRSCNRRPCASRRGVR